MHGCHNPNTHDFKGGFSVDVDTIKEQILDLEGQDGITLSGGDPFFQVESCSEIAEFCKYHNINVWCYTGFTFEKLLKMSKENTKILDLLSNIDVLIDGKFVEKQRDLTLLFKGSRNQRILDIKESLKQGRAVELKRYKEKSVLEYGIEHLDVNSFGKVQYMFI